MNYGQIYTCDVANGPGIRVSLFVSGCTHHCPGCFNRDTWGFSFGKPYTEQTKEHVLTLLNEPFIQGLTLLGGEPMEPENQECVYELLRDFRECYGVTKDVWIYSGYLFEQLTGTMMSRANTEMAKEILRLSDVLVDGLFILNKKDVTLRFRGSKNQRVLDAQKSLEHQAPIWLEQFR